jgi:hypothetical protein
MAVPYFQAFPGAVDLIRKPGRPAGVIFKRCWVARSAVEYKPADFVSQPLIVQNKIANCIRQLLTLPLTLQATCLLPFPLDDGGPCSPDSIGGCAQLMCRNMRYCRSLSGGIGRLSCSSAQLSGGCHGVTGSISGLRHRDFAAHPCPSLREGLARPRVRRLRRLEQVQDVFRTRCGPQGEQLMVGVGERPSAAYGDEPGVAFLW